MDDHELETTHKQMKQKIMDFVKAYFYGIDIDNCQIVFTAGRNEYRNKGIDMFIDALAQVRDDMDNSNFISSHPELSKKTIVAFVIAPQANYSFN